MSGVPNSRPVQPIYSRIVSTSQPPSDDTSSDDSDAEATAAMDRYIALSFLHGADPPV
jgi:hypothetical protein